MKKANKKKKGILNNRWGTTPLFMMALLLVSAIALVVIITNIEPPEGPNYLNKYVNKNSFSNQLSQNSELKTFASAEEFIAYLDESDNLNYGYSGITRNMAMPEASFAMDEMVKSQDMGMGIGGGEDSAGRVSETNVQVVGIDEPDIVKTNGKEIFFSSLMNYYYRGTPTEPAFDGVAVDFEDSRMIMPPMQLADTKVINAYPVEDLELLKNSIPVTGNLLLSGDNLLVLTNQDIYGYDISDPANPKESWKVSLGKNTYLVTARLYDKQVYLITQQNINRARPCPIEPLFRGENALKIACSDIYYPIYPTSVDSTFTAINLNPANGQIDNSVSFVGSSYASTIYMSEKAIYATYNSDVSMYDFMYNFINNAITDLLPKDSLAKMRKMNNYDISTRAKMTELESILEDWMNSIDEDEMMRIENEMQNRSSAYYKEHMRELNGTGIVKIDLKNLSINSSGKVPGTLLNQFAMDEYDGYLRVATTIGDRWGFGFGSQGESANDVYVLDNNLKIKGSIMNLGLDERIYSVRFVGDNGYLVTFRQVDPFYILDLSNPSDPKMTGELKIPGYSSYLHPITKEKILGIGMEDGRVKLSYFDVSDPQSPREIDKYNLADYGSEALYDHHAFLIDTKHEIFFLPSYKGGYVFSYKNDKLELVRTVSLTDVKRAIYLDDYLYIIATDYIAVLNENDWEKVNEIDLNK